MKVLLLAGEESGLLYARRLAAALPDAEIRGYADYGFETSDLAVMGFGAVLARLPFFLRVRRTMERAIDAWRPDVVCTIDYPGMNLRLAAYAKARGIRTVHVVCPQVWAWKSGRIPRIEASLDRLCCFFPFEPALFRPGFATFVGHPLACEFPAEAGPFESGLVALLPGSRTAEVERNLPPMLDAFARAAAARPGLRACIPAANARVRARIDAVLAARASSSVSVVSGGARALLARAEGAVVASGTATLEAALSHCPTVLVYRTSPALAWIARRLVKGIRFIGLANIVWDKSAASSDPSGQPMPEFIQEAFTPEAVASALLAFLGDPAARRAAVARQDRACASLACEGDPIARIAAVVSSCGETLLEVSDLRVAFPVRGGVFARKTGEVRAVDGVSFSLRRGATLGVVGGSGCGKSTTARAILRLVKPTGGTIRFGGADLATLSGAALRTYRRRVQAVFQDPLESLNPRMTVETIVTEAAVAHGVCPAASRRAFAVRLLGEVGLGPETLERYPHALSGGERQRVSIARALSLDPEILVCDEAVSALDLSVRAQVIDLLMALKKSRRLTILFITHDLGVVRRVADDLVVMEKGRVVEAGPCAEVLGRPAHPATKRLLASVLRLPPAKEVS